MFKSVSIHTLGCRVNSYESARIADAAESAGIALIPWGEKADAAIINSCALTTLAEAKTRQAVRIFARANPDSQIAITGCCAQTNPEAMLKLANVKWVISNPSKLDSVGIMLANSAESEAKFFDSHASAQTLQCRATSALDDRMNLKIQDGCDNACSYCIIPRARGLPKSRGFAEILEDAENLVSRGVREIIVTGINISKFDTPDGGLVEIIDELADIKNLLRIRIGSIEPPHFPLDALLERMADHTHPLAPHFHISAQSLSDNVLNAMRRKYSAADFLKSIEAAKTSLPDICVGTDIICGHPHETHDDFLETRRRLQECGLSYAHVFTFSARQKTLAAKMPQVPVQDAKARAKDLRAVAAKIGADFISSQLGKTRRVLLENQLPNGDYLAYTDNYIQVAVNIPQHGLKNRLADVKLSSPISADTARANFLSFFKSF